jgi:hypothetical protein
MLRRFAILLGIVLLLAMTQPVLAQNNYPRAEIFGGFSYLPAGRADFPRKDSGGFQASFTGNITRGFGIVADFGGQYRKVSDLWPGNGYPGITVNTSVHEYLVGPRFAVRRKKFTLFFHGLVGGAAGHSELADFASSQSAPGDQNWDRESAARYLAGFSDSLFTFGGGGGLDINLGERIAIRVIQLDYIGSFVDILEDNARLGFGIVIKLGGS